MLYDTIVIGGVRRAVQHHGGYVEIGQVIAEVGEPGIDAGVAGVRRGACRIGIPAAADYIVKSLASYVDYDPEGVLRRLTKVLATAEPFGYQSDSLAETSFNDLWPPCSAASATSSSPTRRAAPDCSRHSRHSSAPARGRRGGPSSASTICCADIALACATRGSPALARPRSRRPTTASKYSGAKPTIGAHENRGMVAVCSRAGGRSFAEYQNETRRGFGLDQSSRRSPCVGAG